MAHCLTLRSIDVVEATVVNTIEENDEVLGVEYRQRNEEVVSTRRVFLLTYVVIYLSTNTLVRYWRP
jgi:hypothetical protein